MEDDSTVNLTSETDIQESNDEAVGGDQKVNGGMLIEDKKVEPPNVGMLFNSHDEVRFYYNKYAMQLGFSTIKKSSKSGDDGNLKYFTLACALSGKDGSSMANTSYGFNLRKRLPPRTDCKAKINVTICADGQAYVSRVVLEHNHELMPGKQWRTHTRKVRGEHMVNRPGMNKKGRRRSVRELHSVQHGVGASGNSTSDPAPQRVQDSSHLMTGSRYFPKTRHSVEGNMSNNSNGRSSVPKKSQSCQAVQCALATKAIEYVRSGMVLGLGKGSIMSVIFEEFGKVISSGKLRDILAITANHQSKALARQCGLSIVDLNNVNKIDIAFDEVDEVDFNKNALKGGGPGYTLQKIVDCVANQCFILVDHVKVVPRIGRSAPVPVEVLPPAVPHALKQLIALGGVPEVRSALAEDGPTYTDLGNMIVDVRFPDGIQNPIELEKKIKMIPGVVENGIVAGVATTVLVAVKDRGGSINVMNLEDYVKVVLERRDETSC